MDTLTDYSQSGEQAAILKAIDNVGIPPGRFLDIGAGDGETFSNTRALALAGWAGVLVEPASWAFSKLMALYENEIHAGRIRAVCAVVTADQRGLVDFLYAKDDHLSTVDPNHAAAWPQVRFLPVKVAAITVDDLLELYGGGFEVVSIDAEGLTDEIRHAYARHSSFESVRILVVEQSERGKRLLAPGWEVVARTPNNVVLAR